MAFKNTLDMPDTVKELQDNYTIKRKGTNQSISIEDMVSIKWDGEIIELDGYNLFSAVKALLNSSTPAVNP